MRSAVLLLVTACRLNFDDVGRSVDAPSLSSYEQAVIADHPIAYWRLDDTGTIAHDELGMHDGNFSSGVTTGVAGALVDDPDRATSFDGIVGEATTTTGISFPNSSPRIGGAPQAGGQRRRKLQRARRSRDL
ncbi:MAG TPA: hypothetical protein VF403_05645 [Kofleriaceae bacterium]